MEEIAKLVGRYTVGGHSTAWWRRPGNSPSRQTTATVRSGKWKTHMRTIPKWWMLTFCVIIAAKLKREIGRIKDFILPSGPADPVSALSMVENDPSPFLGGGEYANNYYHDTS